jgi:hypothetical protein
MGYVKLHQPHGLDREVEEPRILPFHFYAGRLRGNRMDLVSRARTLHQNRHCPQCYQPRVEPLELDDAVLNRNGMPIPGTATLVGFHCLHCHSEWPA